MLPWLITISVLLLVIAGLIVERAVSGYLFRKEFRELRASQERGFAQLEVELSRSSEDVSVCD